MSSILSKSLRILTVLVLVLAMCFSIVGCDKNRKDIKETDQICVSGAYVESFMYVFTDEAFVDEMVKVFENLKYEDTDESVDMMTAGKVFSFTFSNGNDTLARFIVDSNNTMTFEAGTQCYKIVSEFDFEHIKALVNEQIDTVSGSSATSDEA